MAETVKIEGLKELANALRELPARIGKSALRGAVYAGAKVIKDEAKQRAPQYTGPVSEGHPPPGTLKRSIIIKQIREKSSQSHQTFYVTVRKGKKYQKQGKKGNLSQDAYYASWVEFGTAKMSARPFLRPAFESRKSAAVEAIKSKLSARIEEEATKLGRK